MIQRFLRTCSFVCCAFVIASFALFALDQTSGASSQQVAQINSGSPTADSGPNSPHATIVHAHHAAVRRFIDNAASDLTYPIHSVLPSGSEWGDQLLLLAFGLVVYGVGLRYLARYTAGWS